MSTLKLLKLTAKNFASLRDETVVFGDLNVFIGANASGKSTILDALRFLQDGLRLRDFRRAVGRRGGARYLFQKWEKSLRAELRLLFEDTEQSTQFNWTIGFITEERDFVVDEKITMQRFDDAESSLLWVERGIGCWMSGNGQKIQIEREATTCALAHASVDADFEARILESFVADWRFIDPNLFAIRRRWQSDGSERLSADGSNLLERLHTLKASKPEIFEQIGQATQSVLGMPERLTPVVHNHDDDHEVYHLHFHEKGLISPVTQESASSGTLRILALMTTLYESPGRGLIGIEEPENNIHPSALGDFVQYLVLASRQVQLLITTHSPILLDYLEDPNSVCVVKRDVDRGTRVDRENNPEGVRNALNASGFSLGEFHQTKGFGS